MRVACVLITHLRAKVELQRQPHLGDRAVVIADRFRGRPLVADRFPACAGVTAGMTLEEALSHNAGTVVLEADEPSYQRMFSRVLTALQGVSDRVESAGLGTAYVRLDGLERLHGGEDAVVYALLRSLPEHLRPRIGVGDAKFPAFVAALTSDAPGVARVPPDTAAFLAPNSVELLPVDLEARSRMHRFGLHTMGEIAAMRPEPLLDQFRGCWQTSMGAFPRHRYRSGGPSPIRGVRPRARRAPIPFDLRRVAADGGGHPAQAGLRPSPDAGPLRGQGDAGVHSR